jgi:sulfatase maturation enzyme AslB (radical SAM superfamily)
MVDAPGFESWQQMQDSDWLSEIFNTMDNDQWPKECRRCQYSEQSGSMSIRQAANQRDLELQSQKDDYLILGGVLDNICNSACQSCNANLSTKIGSLSTKQYPRVDNTHLFSRIPMDRVIEIDLNGGEPTASVNYQMLLDDLPDQVRIVRVNTNGSRLLPNLKKLLDKHHQVIITLSLDGTGQVHDYVRWPIKWSAYQSVVESYRDYRDRYPNLELQAWTTVHALNISDWPNISTFARQNRLDHSWAWLEYPQSLSAMYKNTLTVTAREILSDFPEFSLVATGDDNQEQLDTFVSQQDQLRGINIKDYL